MSKNGGSYEYTLKIGADIEQVKTAAAQVQKIFGSLNLEGKGVSNVNRLFGNLDKALLDLEQKSNTALSGISDSKKVEASVNKINGIIQSLNQEFSKLGGQAPAELAQSMRAFADQMNQAEAAQRNYSKTLSDIESKSKDLAKAESTATENFNKATAQKNDLINKQNVLLTHQKNLLNEINQRNSSKERKQLVDLENLAKSDVANTKADIKALAGKFGAKVSDKTGYIYANDMAKLDPQAVQQYEQLKGALESAQAVAADAAQALREYDKVTQQCQTNVATAGIQISKLNAQIATQDKVISEAEQKVKDASNAIKQFNESARTADAFEKLKEDLAKTFGDDTIKSVSNVDELNKKLEELGGAAAGTVQSGLNQCRVALSSTQSPLANVAKQAHDATVNFQQLGEKSREIDHLGSRLKYFFSIMGGFNLMRRAIRDAVNTTKELDAVMTETAVVSQYSVGDMWKTLPKYSQYAKQLGAEIKDVYSAQTLYVQQGLDMNSAMDLGIETMKMARVAGIDAAEATNSMTAALRGFNMELNETSARRVNDVYSKLAQNTASNVQEISTAMSKVAALANSANMSFENTSAFLATIIESTREGAETAGTALKTVIARFTEVKKLYSEGELTGTDEEGQEVDVNKISAALRTAGINMNEFFTGTKGLDEIFKELGSKWSSLTTVQQRYIATMAAGSRQQSRFLALMQNYSRTLELTEMAYNSAGSGQEQFEKTLESLSAKLNNLQTAWNTFIMGIANSEAIKGTIDVITSLIDKINELIDKLSGKNSFSKSFASIGLAVGAFTGARAILRGTIGRAGSIFRGENPAQRGYGVINSLKNTGMGFTYTSPFIGRKNRKEVFNNLKLAKINQTKANDQLKNLQGQYTTVAQQEQDPEGYKKYLNQIEEANKRVEESDNAVIDSQKAVGTALAQSGQAMQAVGIAAGITAGALALFATKAEETGNIPLAKTLKGAAAGFTALATTLTLCGSAFQAFGAAAQAGSAVAAGAIKAIPIIGWAAAIISVLIGVISIIEQFNETIEEKIERVNSELEQNKENLNNLQTTYNDLNDTIEDFKNIESAFDGLIQGTDEWNNKTKELTENIDKLIELVPELNGQFKYENGKLTIDQETLDKYLKIAQDKIKNEEIKVISSEMQLANFNLTKQKQENLANFGIDTRRSYFLGGEGHTNLLGANKGDLKSYINQDQYNDIIDKLIEAFEVGEIQITGELEYDTKILGDFLKGSGLDKQKVDDYLKFHYAPTAAYAKNRSLTIANENDISNATYQLRRNAIESAISEYDDNARNFFNTRSQDDFDKIRNEITESEINEVWLEYRDAYINSIPNAINLGQGQYSLNGEMKQAEEDSVKAFTRIALANKKYEEEVENNYKIYQNFSKKTKEVLAGQAKRDQEVDDIDKTNLLNIITEDDYNKILNENKQRFLATDLLLQKRGIEAPEKSKVANSYDSQVYSTLGNIISDIADNTGFEAAQDAFNYLSRGFTRGGKDITKDLFSAIEKIDFNQITNIDDFLKELELLGVTLNADGKVINNLYNIFSSTYKKLKTFNLSTLKEDLKDVEDLKDKVKASNGEPFDQETYNDLIKNGAKKTEFIWTGQGWTYIGGSLDNLANSLDKNTDALTQNTKNNIKNQIKGANNFENIIKRSAYSNKSEAFVNEILSGNLAEEGIGKTLQDANIVELYNKTTGEFQKLADLDDTAVKKLYDDTIAAIAERNSLEAQLATIDKESPFYNKTADYARQFGASAETQQALALNEAQKEGLDNDAFVAYAQRLNEIEGIEKEFAYAIALDNMMMNNGIEELAKNYETWQKALESEDTTTEEYSTTLKLFNDTLQKITGTTADFSKKFMTAKENAEMFKKAAEGDTDAINQLRKAGAKDILEIDSLGEAGTELNNLIDNLDLDKIAIGTELSPDFTNAFQQLLDAGVLTADQVNQALESIGYEPKITWVEADMSTVDEAQSTVKDFNGGVHSTKSTQVINGKTMIPVINGEATVYKGGAGSTVNTSNRKGGGGGGGGGGGKEYKNDFDKYYNMVEDSNELERLRNLLETDYNQLLKEETKSAKQIYDNLKQQIKLLRERATIEADLAEKRRQQIIDTMSEKEYQGLQKYAWWNDQDRTVEINWDLINTVKDSEQGSLIKEYVSKMEDFQSKYDEAIETLEDIESTIQEIEKRGREEYTSLEDRTRDALIKQIQDKIDELTAVDEAINDANQKLFDSISQTLELQRQDRDNAQTEEELTDKEKRLAYLQQDSSNANAVEIAKLQEELADARQDYTDTLIDQRISELQRQNDEAQEQRQQQIELMQQSLEWEEKAGVFWDEVYRLISEGTDVTGSLVKASELEQLLKNGEAWDSLSEEGKMKWLEELEDIVAQGLAYLELSRQLEDVGTKAGTSITFTTADGKTLTGTVDKNGNVVVKDVNGGSTTYKDVYQDYHGAYKTYETAKEAAGTNKPTTSTSGATSAAGAGSGEAAGSWALIKNGEGIVTKIWGRPGNSGQYKTYKEAATKANEINQAKVEALNKEINELNNEVNQLKSYLSNSRLWSYDKQMEYQDKLKLLNQKQNDIARIKASIIKFKTGGVADFTGPAWLDGTKSRPELVLNARDTENFIQLKDTLADMRRSSESFGSKGDVYFDIDVQVDQMNSDYDVDQAIDRIKARIVQDGAYRNVNTLSRLR